MTALSLPQIAGDQTNAGATANEADSINEAAIADAVTVNYTSDADASISLAGVPAPWQYAVIRVTDTSVVLTAARALVWPDVPRRGPVTVLNATAQIIALKRSGQTGVSIPPGRTRVVRDNGTDIEALDLDQYLRSFTVVTLPSPAGPPRLIYVSDGTSNKRLAVNDGSNWRWPDGAVVS